MKVEEIQQVAQQYGLECRGSFRVTPDDKVPDMADGSPAVTLLLFGQLGSSIWPFFNQSSEFADGKDHPLDRWSERVGAEIAEALNGQLLLPFGNGPHHPFISWAKRVENVSASPLGLLIHPEYGLWHAYRFAVASHQVFEFPATSLESKASACVSCTEKPCLNACPVNAFDGLRYDVSACFDSLQEHINGKCHVTGCLAREACPEGAKYHYVEAQKRFHMRQFFKAMQYRSSLKKTV